MHDPDIVVAADWSTSPQKRWMARAERTAAGYRISHPVPVGDLEKLLARIRAYAKGGSALVGFDFPIGLPHEYARRRFAEANFRAILPQLDARFFEPTNEPEAGRPFGPASSGKGGLGPGWLAAQLELNQEQLRRECDRCTKANPLFFTLGARQGWRAADTGRQEALKPGQ